MSLIDHTVMQYLHFVPPIWRATASVWYLFTKWSDFRCWYYTKLLALCDKSIDLEWLSFY